jgi:hypothetical protein
MKNNKAFDCVEMKSECQRRLQEEYETRKAEFSSYFAFLRAKAGESAWVRQARKGITKAPEMVKA